MKTKKENIKSVQKIVHELRDIENEKLYQLLNTISQELKSRNEIAGNFPISAPKFEELHEKMFAMIKHERDFILPYIDKLLYKESNHDADSKAYYQNLALPIKKLITDHHETFLKLDEIKMNAYSFSYMGGNNFEFTKLLSDLFDLYQLFEKHIYLEENILFPQLIEVFESAGEDAHEDKKTYSHLAVDIL